MSTIHQDDYSAIGTQHEQVTGRINDMLIELQNHAYATGVERSKELAKQAAIEAGTIPPTLCTLLTRHTCTAPEPSAATATTDTK